MFHQGEHAGGLPAEQLNKGRQGGAGSQLVDGLFGAQTSVYSRFPGLDGVLLQEAIWTAYAIEKNACIPFVRADGKTPNVVRHRLNDRDQEATVEALATSIEKRGALVGVRGLAWAVKPDGDGPYQMISWGHLCDAVLLAASRSPSNPYVQATLKKGIVNAVVFNHSTPDDVLLHLVRLHNEFHRGSGESFLDVLSDLKILEQRWAIHRKAQKIVARGGTGEASYATIYWKWVQQSRPGFASSWQQYESWKAVLSFLERNNFYDDFKAEFNRVTRFMEPRIKNDNVLSLMHHAAQLLTKVQSTVPAWLFKAIVFELFKFIVPVRVSPRGDVVKQVGDDEEEHGDAIPWVFSTVMLDKLKWLDTPMQGSTVYNPNAKKAKAAPPRKKQRNGTSPPLEADEAMTMDVKTAEGDSRPKVWIDDVVAAMMTVLNDCRYGDEPPADQRVQVVVKWLLSLSFCFCFVKTVHLNGKCFAKWSDVRTELKRTLYAALRHTSSIPLDSAQLLLDVANSLTVSPTDSKAVQAEFEEYAKDNSDMLDYLTEFLRANPPGRKANLHRVFGRLSASFLDGVDVHVQALAQKLAQKGEMPGGTLPVISVRSFLSIFGEALEKHFDNRFVDFATKLGRVAADTESMPQCVSGAFATIGDVGLFLRQRPMYLLTTMMSAATGPDGVLDMKLEEIISAKARDFCNVCTMDDVIDSVAVVDSQFATGEQWIEAWCKILTKLATTRPGAAKAELLSILDEFNLAPKVKTTERIEIKSEVAGSSVVVREQASGEDEHAVVVTLKDLYMAADLAQEIPVEAGRVPVTLDDLFKKSRVYMDSLSLQAILFSIQSGVWQTAARWASENRATLNAVSVECDTKGCPVGVFIDKKKEQDVRLYYGGVVTLSKTKNAILIGNVESLPLYISPGPHDKLASGCFVPAWTVETAADIEDRGINATLKAHRIEVNLPSSTLKKYEGAHPSIQVVIEVPYLSVASDEEGRVKALKAPPSAALGDETEVKSKGRGRGRGKGPFGKDSAAAVVKQFADVSKKIGSCYWLEKTSFSAGSTSTSTAAVPKEVTHLVQRGAFCFFVLHLFKNRP